MENNIPACTSKKGCTQWFSTVEAHTLNKFIR
jgi:hypothetical protein